jgi:hypothetical protein
LFIIVCMAVGIDKVIEVWLAALKGILDEK